MAGEIPYSAIHNTTYSGDPDYYWVFPGPEFSPPHFPDASLNGWDFEIDPTRLPSHLLSGINQHGGFTLPPDSDLEINDQYGSSLHPNAGSSLDRLDVLKKLLFNTDDNGVESQECSPELQKRMNDLGSLLMPLDSRKQQSIDSEKQKNTRGRPMIQITKEDFLQCKGRTLAAVADELNVSPCTLKRRLDNLTGYKNWSDFQRSKSFPRCVPIYVDYRGEKIPFDLPLTAELGLLQQHIEDSLKFEVGTYDINYFDGEQDLSIRCTSNLEYCLPRAVGGAPIVLNVVKHI